MERFFGFLGAMGLGDYVRFDLSVVRGLAYYTGIVFELFDTRGELRAICGGGRYDDLLKRIAGTDLPALGFGMGDVVLTELLRDRGLLPDTKPVLDYYVAAPGPEQRGALLALAHSLRDAGHSVEYSFAEAGRNRLFKNASALNARRVAWLGAAEVAAGEAFVRDTGTGEERRIPLAELARSN
jgi:histidyl-tRNA synthetase